MPRRQPAHNLQQPSRGGRWIPEPHDAIAPTLQQKLTLLVVGSTVPVPMHRSLQLDHQPERRTVEIDDEPQQDVLPAEPGAAATAQAEVLPEPGFRRRGRRAKFPGAASQGRSVVR